MVFQQPAGVSLSFLIFLSALAFSSLAAHAKAGELSDADWMAYFGTETTGPREYKVTTVSPFGHEEFRERVDSKGTTSIAGHTYRESAAIHDSGLLADKTIKTFVRTAEDGLYERMKNGKEVTLVPRPLKTGHTWVNGKGTFTFEGIEDFDTSGRIVPSCAKITVTSQAAGVDGQVTETRDVKYYERGKGLIYVSVTNGSFEVTKVLSAYAGAKKR